MEKRILSIFPNPFNETLNVHYVNATSETFELNIFTIEGKLLLKRNISGHESISTKNWCRGIYFAELKTSKIIITKKIIKQ